MNTRSFTIGFAVMDSLIEGVVTTKRGIVHAAKSTKNGAVATTDAVTSFFAGASQAVKYRRGTCRMLAHDVTENEE